MTIDKIENTITIAGSGNCNFAYLTGLANYSAERSELALKHALTGPITKHDSWGRPLATFAAPEPRYLPYGMLLFAQGSTTPISENPYAPRFMQEILKAGLGKVIEHEPVPNIVHGGMPGVLFVWIINHTARRIWWEVNVRQAHAAAERNTLSTIKKEIG
jgi:hypothetical protein